MKHVNYLKKVFLPFLVMLVGFSQSFAAPLNGTYTVAGAGANYSDMNAAVQALISNGVSGACVFNIRAGSYTDNNVTTQATSTWRTTIPAILGASATNTITFQAESGPGTVTMTATGTSSTTLNYVVKFNGCSYLRFKDLTMVNANTSAGRVIEFAGIASNNTVNNCILTSAVTTSTTTTSSPMAVVYAYQMTAGNTNNAVTNCTLNNGNIGFHVWNTSTATLIDNFTMDGNTLTGQYYMGIYSQYTSALKFRSNILSKTGAGTYYGMYTYYNYAGIEIRNNNITANSGVSGSVYGMNLNYLYSNSTAANTVTNTYGAITGNNININTTNTGTGSGSAYGMYHQYCTKDSVSNNTITLVTYTGSLTPFYNYGSSTM